jgi:RNA polymerase sigma-70 factor, ECF subfamily
MSERLPPMAMELCDHELMARLATGDDLALNVLMGRWSDRIVSFLYRMTGRHDVAVDLAQETFVKL